MTVIGDRIGRELERMTTVQELGLLSESRDILLATDSFSN